MRALTVALLLTVGLAAQAVEDVIWDDRPGQGWENSWYPLGNGRLGCMVDGGAKSLKIQFNVDSFWTGDKNITGPVNDRNADANYRSMGAFQNFGELSVVLDGVEGEISSYRRQLDLSKALYSDSFRIGEAEIKRRVFASAPDDAIFLVYSLPPQAKLKLNLAGSHNEQTQGSDRQCRFSGRLDNHLAYAACAGVFVGSRPGEQVVVLRAATGDDAAHKVEPGSAPFDIAQLFKRHVAEYRGYYDRCVLDLGLGDQTVPTRKRLARV